MRALGAVLGLAVAFAVIAACQSPTAIVVEVTTDVPCTSGLRTTITVGAGDLNGRQPAAVTDACEVGTGRVGSIVVVPRDGDDERVSIRVVAASGIDPERCAAETVGVSVMQIQGNVQATCIVARRDLRFIPNATLYVPVVMRGACAGVRCAESATCVNGDCVDATVTDANDCMSPPGCDETKVGGAGVAPPPASPPAAVDAGPPEAGPGKKKDGGGKKDDD